MPSSWPPLNQAGPLRPTKVTRPRPAASCCGHATCPGANVGNWLAEAIGSWARTSTARDAALNPSPRTMPAHILAWSSIVVSIDPAALARLRSSCGIIFPSTV